jgi:hypothetical protein
MRKTCVTLMHRTVFEVPFSRKMGESSSYLSAGIVEVISYLITMKLLASIFLTGVFCSSCGQTPYPSGNQHMAPRLLPPPPLRSWQSTMEANLRNLQWDDSDGLANTVYDIASAWAAAGFMKQANQLLALSWNYGLKDPNYFEHINDGFSVMWNLSGERPERTPFKEKSVDEVVQDNWDDLLGLYPGTTHPYSDSIISKPWTDFTGRALSEKAFLLSYDLRNTYHRAGRQEQKEAVLAYTRYFATEKPVGYDLIHSSTIAAIEAANLDEDDRVKDFILLSGRGYLQSPGSLMLASLMKDTATARYLLKGILAPLWGMSDSTCEADLEKVKAILSERMRNGPSLVFGQLTLKQLLQRISDSAIQQRDIDFENTVVKSRWLGYTPAKQSIIKATQQRLGISLPEDYKAFLLTTNGFRPTGSTDVSFLPVEKIGWLRDLDGQLVEIAGQPMDKDDSARSAGFQRSILIGGLNEEQQFLLVPPGGADKKWQYWFFASWLPGQRAYPSFRFYLEYELQFMMDH